MNVTFAAPAQPKVRGSGHILPEGRKLEGLGGPIDRRTAGMSRAPSRPQISRPSGPDARTVAPREAQFPAESWWRGSASREIAGREVELLGGVVGRGSAGGQGESATVAADSQCKTESGDGSPSGLRRHSSRVYSFDKYKSKKPDNGKTLQSLTLLHRQAAEAKKAFAA